MRKPLSWILLFSVAVLASGCGFGGGIEPGIPKNLDKISDPMAGSQMKPATNAKR